MNPPKQFSLPPVHKLPALNLGLRPCAPSDWLDAPDAFGDDLMRTRQLAEKKHLIAEQKSKIYACLPDAQAAETEATVALSEHLFIINTLCHHRKLIVFYLFLLGFLKIFSSCFPLQKAAQMRIGF